MDQEPAPQESGIGEEEVASLRVRQYWSPSLAKRLAPKASVLRLAPQDARAALPQNCHTTKQSLGLAHPFVHITLVTSDMVGSRTQAVT